MNVHVPVCQLVACARLGKLRDQPVPVIVPPALHPGLLLVQQQMGGSRRRYQATWWPYFCYTARALRAAAAVSDPAGLRSAAAPRRLAWSVTQTRNMGWRAFFRRSMIRSGASSK